MITFPARLFGLFLCLGSAAVVDTAWPTPLPTLPAIDVPAAVRAPSLLADPADMAWRNAAVIPALTRSAGDPGAAPVTRTVIRLLWSPQALYVRFEAEDADIVTPYSTRDAAHSQGDVAEVFLDPSCAQRAWYEFAVTPRNGIGDTLHLCTAPEPSSGPDGVLAENILRRDVWSFPEWNCPGLQTAARIVPGGWIAELAIPPAVLHQTGADVFAPGPLRANFLRYDVTGQGPALRRAFLNWSPVVMGRPHRSPSRMGTLHLLPAS